MAVTRLVAVAESCCVVMLLTAAALPPWPCCIRPMSGTMPSMLAERIAERMMRVRFWFALVAIWRLLTAAADVQAIDH